MIIKKGKTTKLKGRLWSAEEFLPVKKTSWKAFHRQQKKVTKQCHRCPLLKQPAHP